MTTTPGDPQGDVQPDAADVDTGASVATMAPDPPAAPADGDNGNRRPWVIGGAVALALVLIGLVIWLLWPSSPSVPTNAQPAPLNQQAVTTVGGQALLSTLRTGEAATYHSSYKVVGDAAQIGGALTLEIWQAPPKSRIDTVLVNKGQTTRAEAFISGSEGQVCTQPAGSTHWSCQTIPKAQVSESGPAGILNAISGQISGHGVSMKKQTIDGYAATCFTVLSAAQPKLCATSDGIPVLIADSEVSYQLISLSKSVSDSVFSVPTQN